MKRHFPDIEINRIEGYAQILAHNFDAIQESYNLELDGILEERLEAGKKKAQERYEDQGMTFFFGGEKFQISPQGTKGKSWVLKNDDFMIMIGRGAKDWKWSVRYLSAGLWEYGISAMKQRILKCLLTETHPSGEGVIRDDISTWQRVSRVDYALDFYCPEFTQEMTNGNVRQNMLLPAKVKGGLYFDSNRDETIWFGIGSKTLQIQIYDKGKEITDTKGKEWFFKIYEREGYYPPEDLQARHIWRVEIRIYKEFIKNRKCLTLDDVLDNLKDMLCEALGKRRLSIAGSDQNKARWDLHPLWCEALEQIGGAGSYLPIGRLSTMKADVKAAMIKKNIAGSLRSVQILETGDYDFHDSMIIAQDCAFEAQKDKEHDKKIDKAKEKYAFEREAQ